jgi:hypothetical protein
MAPIAPNRGVPNLHPQAPVHEHLHVHPTSLDIQWRKSSASNPSGNCVELAELANGEVALRNSRFPAGPILIGSRQEVAEFLRAVRNGQFDDLGR